ncbi:MAG: zf-HC2 domain-containing protein [Planctomycetaceae bacterium]|nr:zf-HC2 domain-containing protein [Planctomycetaceae bacterium]
MTCAEAREALDALLDGELDAAEEAALRLHLDSCAGCERELEELRVWHGAISGALTAEEPDPAEVAESRRRILAALPGSASRRVPLGRIAALLAIGLSIGVVASAVGFSRPPEAQVARLVESLKEQEHRGATLVAVQREIERDLQEARKAVADRSGDDPAARAVEVATVNLSRRLRRDPPDPLGGAGEKVSVTTESTDGTVSVVQKEDGRIRVQTPAGVVEARNMADLLSRHAALCRRYAIDGSDGLLRVAGNVAGADWKGRLDLLLRSGTWDENLQWEVYRGWAAARASDAREVERRLKALQERCQAVEEDRVEVAVDTDAIARRVKSWSRAEIRKHQERVEAERLRLEERLKDATELRARARGLRLFAEDVGHE